MTGLTDIRTVICVLNIYSVLAPPHQCAVVVLDRVLVHASVFKYL